MLRSATTFSTPVWLWRLIGPLVFWMTMTGAIALAFPIGGSGRSPFVPLGLRATPPAPFLEFCLHEPSECGLRSSDLATPEARADFWRRYFWTIAFASHPEPLDANLTSAQSVTVTPAVLVELDAINSYVNRTIRYVPDTVAYGEPDHWDLPIKDGNLRGDCEEFALEKRRLWRRQVSRRTLCLWPWFRHGKDPTSCSW